jgi:MFS family permease
VATTVFLRIHIPNAYAAPSALCATATSLGQMILSRAMQGFCGGAIPPSVWFSAATAGWPDPAGKRGAPRRFGRGFPPRTNFLAYQPYPQDTRSHANYQNY